MYWLFILYHGKSQVFITMGEYLFTFSRSSYLKQIEDVQRLFSPKKIKPLNCFCWEKTNRHLVCGSNFFFYPLLGAMIQFDKDCSNGQINHPEFFFVHIFRKKSTKLQPLSFRRAQGGSGKPLMALLMPPPPEIFSLVEPGFNSGVNACSYAGRAHESILSSRDPTWESEPRSSASAQPEEWEVPRYLDFLKISRWWFQIWFIFTLIYFRKRSNLTDIFQMGWNHQLDFCWFTQKKRDIAVVGVFCCWVRRSFIWWTPYGLSKNTSLTPWEFCWWPF